MEFKKGKGKVNCEFQSNCLMIVTGGAGRADDRRVGGDRALFQWRHLSFLNLFRVPAIWAATQNDSDTISGPAGDPARAICAAFVIRCARFFRPLLWDGK
jgi:hypothetical protein